MKRTNLAVVSLVFATAIQPVLAQVNKDTLQSIATPTRAETQFDAPGADDGGSTAAATAPDTPQAAAPAPAGGGEWHFSVSPYLWLTGVHGTVGAYGRDVGVHASAIDLLSHFRFGLMGAVEARRGRLVAPLDFIWARLGDDSAVPFPGLGATTANAKVQLVILTPKVGVRVFDEEKFKFDVLAGFRYWHLGENLQFSPSILNLNFTRSQNLVDPVVGGRIESALSQKWVVNVLGDVGGWGTGSTLEYQVAGAIGYRVKESITVLAGYRYLDLDYSRGGASPAIAHFHLSGIVLGATFNLK
jgi:hypothetical protein